MGNELGKGTVGSGKKVHWIRGGRPVCGAGQSTGLRRSSSAHEVGIDDEVTCARCQEWNDELEPQLIAETEDGTDEENQDVSQQNVLSDGTDEAPSRPPEFTFLQKMQADALTALREAGVSFEDEIQLRLGFEAMAAGLSEVLQGNREGILMLHTGQYLVSNLAHEILFRRSHQVWRAPSHLGGANDGHTHLFAVGELLPKCDTGQRWKGFDFVPDALPRDITCPTCRKLAQEVA